MLFERTLDKICHFNWELTIEAKEENLSSRIPRKPIDYATDEPDSRTADGYFNFVAAFGAFDQIGKKLSFRLNRQIKDCVLQKYLAQQNN